MNKDKLTKEEFDLLVTVPGLEKALQIINDEVPFAIQVNPHMALGMEQVRKLIVKEMDRIEKEFVNIQEIEEE